MRSSLLDWSITSKIENYPEYRCINIGDMKEIQGVAYTSAF